MLARNVQATDETEYKKVLQSDFPELEIRSIKYVGSGWDRAALLVNNKTIFRLPRKLHGEPTPEDQQATQYEVSLLRSLQGKFSFAIPIPTYVAPDNRYFGYDFIEGVMWEKHPNVSQPSSDFMRAWTRARRAITQALSVDEAKILGVPLLVCGEETSKVQEILGSSPQASPAVLRGLKDDVDYIQKHFSSEALQFTHNDLNVGNIVVDQSGDRIVGIIDFGGAHIAPVSSDFYLWDKWPSGVMKRVESIAQKEGERVDMQLVKAIHRMYVGADIAECRRLGSFDAERPYWRELERCYTG